MVAYPAVPPSPASLRPLVLLTAFGVALRALLFALAGAQPLQSDEANYVYSALVWDHFGHYQDGFRFLWPPGLPWILKEALGSFESGGLAAVMALQVAASASVGLTTMLFAQRLFGARAARVAGILWVLYLPLAAYTHYLWPEPLFLGLFLPALYLLLTVVEAPAGSLGVAAADPRVGGRLGLAGLLLAGALYLKEAPLFLLPPLLLLVALSAGGVREGLWRASLLALAVAVAVTPWTLRNFEVYGRFVPMASTLGENLHAGVNARYKNYDVQVLGRRGHRAGRLGDTLPEDLGRTCFTRLERDGEPVPNWERADELANTPDRLRENVRRGLAFAAEHPGWLVRSRIKKLADLVAPTSFFVRHQALGRYDGSTLGGRARAPLVAWALVCPLLVLPLGWLGLTLALRAGPGRWLIASVLAYFTATGLLVAMSRFRVPMEPLLIVLAAGFLAGRSPRSSSALARAAAAIGLAALAFLWWVDLPEVTALLELASDTAPGRVRLEGGG